MATAQMNMINFGKALGNGYAITAVIGTSSVMQAAQSTFISSTFWTERIGPAAALKTLVVMEKLESWQIITTIGQKLRDYWLDLANIHGLLINLKGLSSLSGFSFQTTSSKNRKYKTLITQEMLKKGYLAATSCYLCISHSSDIIEGYLEILDDIFGLIAECEAGRSVDELLQGPVCNDGFRRLN